MKNLVKMPLLMPLVYVFGIIIGLSLYLLQVRFNLTSNNACFDFNGQEVCTLIGSYIFMFFSIPGYLVMSSKIFHELLINISVGLNMAIAVIVNLFIYYLIGNIIRIFIQDRKDPDKLITHLIIFFFFSTLFFILIFGIS